MSFPLLLTRDYNILEFEWHFMVPRSIVLRTLTLKINPFSFASDLTLSSASFWWASSNDLWNRSFSFSYEAALSCNCLSSIFLISNSVLISRFSFSSCFRTFYGFPAVQSFLGCLCDKGSEKSRKPSCVNFIICFCNFFFASSIRFRYFWLTIELGLS